MPSAKLLFCFNIQSDSMSLKRDEYVVRLSGSLGPAVTPSYSASNPDPSCLHMTPGLCLSGLGLRDLCVFMCIFRSDKIGSRSTAFSKRLYEIDDSI